MKTESANKPKNFSPKQVEKMREMVRIGASYAYIGRKFSCNYKTVQKYTEGTEIHGGAK
jgi:hypothetical protein